MTVAGTPISQVTATIGRTIRNYRDAAGWSQTDLGQRIRDEMMTDQTSREKPWSRQAVWMAERGDRAFAATELAAIARVFGITLADLFAGVDLPEASSDHGRQLDHAYSRGYREGVHAARRAMTEATKQVSPPS